MSELRGHVGQESVEIRYWWVSCSVAWCSSVGGRSFGWAGGQTNITFDHIRKISMECVCAVMHSDCDWFEAVHNSRGSVSGCHYMACMLTPGQSGSAWPCCQGAARVLCVVVLISDRDLARAEYKTVVGGPLPAPCTASFLGKMLIPFGVPRAGRCM